MTVKIHKLKKDGERYESHTTIGRVTKLEEIENILRIHTYFSDKGIAEPMDYDLEKYGVDVFVGNY